MDGFCSACIREGFDDVYSVTGNDDGWRWREAWANRSNFSALRGVIMARGGSGFSGQEESGWVLRGSRLAVAPRVFQILAIPVHLIPHD